MEHFFTLPVTYQGMDYEYKARLVTFGYSFKFHVMVDKRELIFERDDEMNLRALDADPGQEPMDPSLLAAIAAALEHITKR
jgi:hypothetical protein